PEELEDELAWRRISFRFIGRISFRFIGHTLLVKIGSLNYCVMLIYFVLEIFDNNINSAKFITAGFSDIINFRSYVIQNFLRLLSEVIITCLVFSGFRGKFT